MRTRSISTRSRFIRPRPTRSIIWIWRLHSNSTTTSAGSEAKAQIDPHQIHETLEATFGVLPHVEVGQYFCTAKLGDHYEYAGSRTKMHFGIPQTMDWPVSFGGNIELDYMRHAAEDQPLTLEMRPIAESHIGKVLIVANLPFEKPFSGAGTHKGVTLSPQGEIVYQGFVYEWLSPAVEYYGDMGAIRSLPGVQNQQQFIVPTLNFDFIPQLETQHRRRHRDDARKQRDLCEDHHWMDVLKGNAETKLRMISVLNYSRLTGL